VSLAKLKDGVPATVTLRKGSVLPGTKTHLQADNFGIQFNNLYKHLNHMVEYLLAAPPAPALTDNFKNPYTDETTVEILGVPAKTKGKVETVVDSQKKDSRIAKLFAKTKSLFQ